MLGAVRCGRPVSTLSGGCATLLVAMGLGVPGSSVPAASAATSAPFKVSVSPTSLEAGSPGVLRFRFSATAAARSRVSVVVPAVARGLSWTRPQSSSPARAGFVRASKRTCRSASVSSVTGTRGGPWKIVVNARCAKRRSFVLGYGTGTGAARVTAATEAGLYTFTTKARSNRRKRFVALEPQPAVTVVPGPAATLALSGVRDAAAGMAQAATIALHDRFGNRATGYRGVVRFTSTDSQALLPTAYMFTAADAGLRAFASGVTLKTAGSHAVTAADAVDPGLTDSQHISVGPGPAHNLEVTGLVDATAGDPQSPTVTAQDEFGNTATGYRGTVRFAGSGDPRLSDLCGCPGWVVPADYTFTESDAGEHGFPDATEARVAGSQTLTATDLETGTIEGSQTITISPDAGVRTQMIDLSPDGAVIVGQRTRAHATAAVYDFFGNSATSAAGPVSMSVGYFTGRIIDGQIERVNVLSEADVPVVNGQVHAEFFIPTFETLTSKNFSGNTNINDDNDLLGLAVIGVKMTVVEPLLTHATLNLSPTPNADGNFVGTLDVANINMSLNPSSIRLDGVPITLDDGTKVLSLSATTLGGDPVAGQATVTSFANTTTGELLPGTSGFCTAPCEDVPIAVGGCLTTTHSFETAVNFDVPDSGIDLRIAEDLCQQVASDFIPVFTNVQNPEAKTVIATQETPENMIAVVTDLTDWQCTDPNRFWNEALETCQDTG